MLKNLCKSAEIYHEYAEKDVLVIYAKSKTGPFHIYEFHAGIENFQHLAGIKYPKGAKVFYDKCVKGNIQRKDIVPVNNIKITSSKIEVLPAAIDLKNSNMYRIGKKNLITEFNQFSIAIGNSTSVMGLEKRGHYLPVPITVVNDNISRYCSAVESIFMVATKAVKDSQYSYLLYERTNDILAKAEFSEEIQKKISCKIGIS